MASDLRGPILALCGLVLLLLASVSCGLLVSFDPYSASVPLYAVGGMIDGLEHGTVTVRLNGQSPQSVGNGAFVFPRALRNGERYVVGVEVASDREVCSLEAAEGTVMGADVTSIAIHCRHPDVATLASLSLSVGVEANVPLTPPFDGAIERYTLGPLGVSAIFLPRTTTTVTATATDPRASIRIAGNSTPSGTASAPIPLAAGSTSIGILVTAADGKTEKTYSVAVAGYPGDHLNASNARPAADFGSAVALSDETLVVGARYESTLAKGVNGDRSDRSAEYAGAVYVFSKTGMGAAAKWSETAFLKASNTRKSQFLGASFGQSVALSGDTLVVGAPGEASIATGVNGDQTDASAVGAGAVYVFVRTGTGVGAVWSQQAYLKASNTRASQAAAGAEFGASVALSGDTLVVGAPSEASGATGVNGNQADASMLFAGAAYVFTRSGTTWSQQAYVKASNTRPNASFGQSVAISADTIAVGSNNESSGATGVGGNQSDATVRSAGAVYVFTRTGATWSQQAYVKASNTRNQPSNAEAGFGVSLALSGDTLAVGADHESSGAVGINGNQADTSATGAGAVYVFARTGTTWSQQAYVKASNTRPGASFGTSVALSFDTLAVGSVGEMGHATGVNGNQAEMPLLQNAGAAYVFRRAGTTWSQQAYVKASNTARGAWFGTAVALAAKTLAVGAEREVEGTGAAYVFR